MSSIAETQNRPATSPTTESRSHWTIYPSLLKTLENDSHIIALENAVCAHHCGRYHDGRNIFDEQLPPSSSLPILALERSDMLTTQGLEHERIALLKQTLENERAWSTKVTGGEKELLSLLLADAEYWAYGKMKGLLNEARSMREWLALASVADLSDIQVRCIIAYYSIMIECRRQSNWIIDESDGIIFLALGQEPWTELSAVRRSLRAQDRLIAATRIAIVDKSQRKDLALQSLCEDLIELCGAMEAAEEDSLRYKACTTRLIISGLLKSLGSEEASAKNMLVAQENLKSLQSVEHTTWADFSPRVALDLSIKAIEEATVQDNDRIIQLQALAEDARKRKDLTKERLIFISSVNAAQRWHEKAGTNESRQLYSKLEQDFLFWEATTAKLATLQAYALSRVLTTLRYTTSEWDEIINQYTAFDEQFSGFDIPAIQERLLNTTLSAAEQLKDDKLKKKYRKTHNIYWLQCPFSETGEEGAEQAKRAYKLSTSAQNDPLYFRRELYHPDPNQMCIRVVRVLLRWARNEMEGGLLSLSDGFQAFGFIKVSGEGEEVPIDWTTAGDDQDPSFYERVVNMMYGSPEPASEDEWRPRFQRIEDWLLLEDHPPFTEARHFVLKSLQKARVNKINDYWIKRQTVPDVNGAKQIMAEDDRLESILSQITPEARSETDLSESQGNIIKNTIVSASVPNAADFGLITDEKLQRALEVARHLAPQHRSQERYKLEYFVHLQSARLLYYRYLTFHSVPASAILLPLEQADTIFRELQREQSVLQGSRSLVAKTAVSSQLMQATLYDQALAACLGAYSEWSHGNFASGKESGSNFVSWIQRSKARALNDGLGLQAELPMEITSAIEQSPASKRLLAKESLMLQQLPDLQLQAKLKLRKSLDEIRAEMRRDPILRPAMDFRDGTTITHEEIEKMLSELGEDVVIVEYVHILYMGTMRIILYRAQSTQILDVPDIRMVDVIAWVKDNLDVPPNVKKSNGPFYPLRKTPQKPSDPYSTLHKMSKLIEPLATSPTFTSRSQAEPLVRPGETIIFCPTKAIHRVPLHALKLAGIPLIVRNPVVYCQSLSTLRYCYLSSRDSFLAQPLTPKRTFLHLLPSHDYRSGEETTLATGYVDDIARQLNSEAYVGYGRTKSAIFDAITSSSLLHYHGHVNFKPMRPLSSGLIINDNKPEPYAQASKPTSQPPAEAAAKPKASLLTATEIFTLKLHRGAHVNLIGCESGLAEINDNDDLHGLVTAFHYAGASSVVSTLWSIDDDDGMIFSKAFFDNLVRQHDAKTNARPAEGGRMHHLLDTARATQEAVMALRGEEGSPRDPYHWAGMVLNGYWNCPSQVLALEDR